MRMYTDAYMSTLVHVWSVFGSQVQSGAAAAMPGLSSVQKAKRALVTLLLALARAYGVDTAVSRESADADLQKAFRKLSRHVHPDKGGNPEDAQRLSAARDVWEAAQRGGPQRSRPAPAATVPATAADP